MATNLNRARKLRGFSMEELAQRINCTKQTISNYENGLRYPDGEMLLSIAQALNVDLDYFFNDCNVNFSLNKVNYREGLLLNDRERNEIESMTAAALNDYLELESIAKDYVDFQNPLADLVISNESDAEKAAKQLRKKWKLGDAPLHNISNFLEKKGVRIIKINFGFSFNHEGLSGWALEDTIPVIILNNKPQDISRVRFTILHELGHLLLAMAEGLEIEAIENICNRFAGAVLLPADILEQEFGKNRTRISMDELRRIKESYGISIAAIMVRARFTGLINYQAYHNWKTSDLSDYDFGQFNGTEEPQKFLQMLYKCLSEKKIGFDKAAKLANVNETSFRQTYHEHLEFSL